MGSFAKPKRPHLVPFLFPHVISAKTRNSMTSPAAISPLWLVQASPFSAFKWANSVLLVIATAVSCVSSTALSRPITPTTKAAASFAAKSPLPPPFTPRPTPSN